MKSEKANEKLNYIIVTCKRNSIDELMDTLKEEGFKEKDESHRIDLDDSIITKVEYDTDLYSKPPVHLLDRYGIKYDIPRHVQADHAGNRKDRYRL